MSLFNELNQSCTTPSVHLPALETPSPKTLEEQR